MSKKKIKLYGIDIESEDDVEYVPEESEESQNNKDLNHPKTLNIDEIYQEMKKIDLYQPKICTKTAQQIVREVLDEQNRIQVKRVKFAGKSFLINDKGEIQEENIEPVQTKQIKQHVGNSMSMKELRESFRYYREVIKKLTNKAKTINSVTKSKLDWNQYTKKEKLETQMEQKRKSGQGVLEKAKFISRTNERTQQNKKIMKLNTQRFIPSLIAKPKLTQQQQPKQEECSKKVYRGQSAENKIINKAQIDNKANTPEMIRVQNGNFSPTTKYTEITKTIKQKNVNQPSKISNSNRPQKSQSIVVEFDQPKNRTSSQFKYPKEITPTKKQNQPSMPQSQRLTIKNQTLTTQSKMTQEKSKINSKLYDVNKIDQRIKTQQTEKYKEEQKIIQKIPLKKVNQKKEIITKSQLEKNPQILSTRQIPSRQSFSPTNQIAKTANTTRGHSPSSYQSDNLNGKLSAILTVIRPIFKEAKYYQTSVIHFLREEFFPNTSPYQVQFKIEFQEQKDYFKTKFCDHFNLTYNSLKHCSQLSSKQPINPKVLNPPKKPHFSSDNVKTLVFDLDETLIHCNDINNNPTDYKTIIHIPNEPETEIHFNIRPHCQQMLKALSQFYELILFTASYKEYADKILEYIDPNANLFTYRFYRESCLELEEGLLVKDLRVIEGRKLENMAIIDNSAYCYIYQLDHGIPIIPFEENKKDKELIFMADYLIKCEKQLNWLQYHKLHFQNQLYLQCSTIEECIKRLLQTQNY